MNKTKFSSKKIILSLVITFFTYQPQDCSVSLQLPDYRKNITPEMIDQQAYKTETVAIDKNVKQINYFDKHNQCIGLGIYTKNNELIDFYIYYPDGKTKQFSFRSDSDVIIAYYNEHTKLTNTYLIGSNNKILEQTVFHNDKTKTITKYNSDNSYKIIECDANNNIVTGKIIDQYDNLAEEHFYSDDGNAIQIKYHADQTKTILYFDKNTKWTEEEYVNKNGQRQKNSSELVTAWHEAGHAVVAMHTRILSVVDSITIISDNNQALGFVNTIPTYPYTNKNIHKELINTMMMNIAGGVAEQILFDKPILTNKKDVIQYFKNKSYQGDMENFMINLQRLLHVKINIQNEKHNMLLLAELEKFLFELYPLTYQLLQRHKHDLQKIVQELMHKKFLTGDEAYDVLCADKPLMFDEEGPLPKSLIGDYIHRGF